MKLALIQALVLTLLATMSYAPAYAQSGSMEGDAQAQTAYKSSYPKVEADSDSSVTVQSGHHLYKPGEIVKIEGSMSSEMKEETEAESTTVTVMDAQGSVIAEEEASIDSNGNYEVTFALPADAEEGEYMVDSKVQVEASILGTLSAEIVAKLQSKSEFVVASSAEFEVKADTGEEFTVNIASNSSVRNVELKQEEKKVSFMVEGETGTRGVTQITVPKAMLSGEMMVAVDGNVVTPESNEVIVTSNTSTEMTFEINYGHSERNVDVTGTNVVPEFPLSTLVMSVAVGSIIAVLAARRHLAVK